ncbi:hypothetical protein ACF3NA_03140 [Alkanindiges sp. WGS2144]|uniref:hypothetical protein n=1 Tax=Alkanindiges sp. WGS2144 TaxID=3366808 RepID=UPI003750ED38
MSQTRAFLLLLSSVQLIAGGWFWRILTHDEPSIGQSGSLVLLMILPAGLIIGGFANLLCFIWLGYRRLNYAVLVGLINLLMPVWLALILLLINAILLLVIG